MANASSALWDATVATTRTAAARGPSLAGVYGAKITMDDGTTQIATDGWLRDTILNPSQHVPAGYKPIMPTYQGQVSEEGLIDLVEYIKTLKSNYRSQQTLVTAKSSDAAPTAADMVKP